MRMFCRSFHCRFLFNVALLTTVLLCIIHMASIDVVIKDLHRRKSPKVVLKKIQTTTPEPQVTKNPLDERELKWLERQEGRRKRMQDHCLHASPPLEQLLNPAERRAFDLLDLTIVDESHQLIYCYVPRIATTNWRRVFLVLTGQVAADMDEIIKRDPRDMSQFKTLRDYTPEQRVQMVNSFRKMLFVRHPFHRLDAIYYDRLRYDRTINDNFQKVIGTDIIRRYRPAKFTSADSLHFGHDVRFTELAEFLTDENNPMRMDNVHFRSISNLCSPCQMNYTFIGKFETLAEDAVMTLKQVNVSLPFGFPAPDHQSRTTDRWVMDMRLLSTDMRQLLYREYRRDFELFDYDPEEWKRG